MSWTLVTGGAKRLGAAICRTLAQKGYPVVFQYRHSVQEAKNLEKECVDYPAPVKSIQGDFSTVESTLNFVKAYNERFPDTHNLINNVGNYFIGSALQTPIEEWVQLFQTNIHTPFLLLNNLLPSIKKNEGSIINLGIAGLTGFRAEEHATAYEITKSGLLLLTRSLAKELAPDLVRVNMVSPGYLEESIDLPKDLSKIPMKRLGSYREVANVILFLLSDKAKYITGQNIEVAGGIRL